MGGRVCQAGPGPQGTCRGQLKGHQGAQCPATLVGWVVWFLSHTKESDPGRKSIILFYNILFFPSFPGPSLHGLIHLSGFLMGITLPHGTISPRRAGPRQSPSPL